MTPGEIRRLYFIIRTFLSYGLDELIPRMRITLPLRLWRQTLFWMPNRHKDKLLGERLRLALQELGPVWIKFGQMLSTRRDLFPPQIADQLALLQDKVAPFDGRLAKRQIEKAMGDIPVESWFDDFDIQPLASASIAQVHTARLKENGKEVVIKVIRPDILPIIRADMRLIYRLARWVPRLLPDGRRLRPMEVVREYEKTLIDELNLLRESANAIQLRRNFENSPMLYVPEVYSDYCSQDMMVMERIYGIPVSDVATLEKQGTNMKLLAERGVLTRHRTGNTDRDVGESRAGQNEIEGHTGQKCFLHHDLPMLLTIHPGRLSDAGAARCPGWIKDQSRGLGNGKDAAGRLILVRRQSVPSSSLLVEEAVLARHLRRASTPATCGGEQEQNDVVDRRIVQCDRQRFERKEERSVEQAEVDEADGDRQQQDIEGHQPPPAPGEGGRPADHVGHAAADDRGHQQELEEGDFPEKRHFRLHQCLPPSR